jgi:hypothetical protein
MRSVARILSRLDHGSPTVTGGSHDVLPMRTDSIVFVSRRAPVTRSCCGRRAVLPTGHASGAGAGVRRGERGSGETHPIARLPSAHSGGLEDPRPMGLLGLHVSTPAESHQTLDESPQAAGLRTERQEHKPTDVGQLRPSNGSVSRPRAGWYRLRGDGGRRLCRHRFGWLSQP